MVTFDSSVFLSIASTTNHRDIIFHNHLPKMIRCLWSRSLSSYKLLFSYGCIYVSSIDEFWISHWFYTFGKSNPCLLIGNNNLISSSFSWAIFNLLLFDFRLAVKETVKDFKFFVALISPLYTFFDSFKWQVLSIFNFFHLFICHVKVIFILWFMWTVNIDTFKNYVRQVPILIYRILKFIILRCWFHFYQKD